MQCTEITWFHSRKALKAYRRHPGNNSIVARGWRSFIFGMKPSRIMFNLGSPRLR